MTARPYPPSWVINQFQDTVLINCFPFQYVLSFVMMINQMGFKTCQGDSTVDGKRNNIAKACVRLQLQSFMINLILKQCYPAGLHQVSWHISCPRWGAIFFNREILIPVTFKRLSRQKKELLNCKHSLFLQNAFFSLYSLLFTHLKMSTMYHSLCSKSLR